MQFFKYTTWGAGAGLAVGSVSSAFLLGFADRASKQNNAAAAAGELFAFLLATQTPIYGLVTGAIGGASLYGGKKSVMWLKKAPRPVQLTMAGVAGTSVTLGGVYAIGKQVGK